jgi:hypothetical protein
MVYRKLVLCLPVLTDDMLLIDIQVGPMNCEHVDTDSE